MEDYKRLAEFHYRNPETHAPILKIYVLRKEDQEPIGVILYSWPPINCSGRRKALGRNLSIREVNEKVATISRVILHPKYRSIGLGARLVEETMPLVGRRCVETMAVMARYNSFFEKAGLRKIEERQPPRSILRAVQELEKLGFKPYIMASSQSNLRRLRQLSKEEIDRVREILSMTGYYKRLQASNDAFVTRQAFKEWLAMKGPAEIAKVISRLAVLAEPKVYLFWENPYLSCDDEALMLPRRVC